MERQRALLGYVGGFSAVLLMSLFGIVLMVLHMLAAGHGGVPRYLSHFRLLPFAWLWLLGLVIFAIGAACLAIALMAALPRGRWSKVVIASLWAVVPLTITVAAFPAAAPGAQTTWVGRVHEGAAIAMFCALGLAMLSLFPALRWGWGGLAWTSLVFGIMFFGVTPWMIRGFVLGTPDVAVSERIVVVLHGTWLMILGVWSRAETAPFARASAPSTRPAPTTPSGAQSTD